MAIKTSNQIIFTEQKNVLDIVEWYLISDKSEGVTVDKDADRATMEANGWSTKVMSTTIDKPYLWNCEQVIYSIGGSEVSEPAVIRTYGKVSDIVNYYATTSSATAPTVPSDLESSDVWTSDFSDIKMSSTNKYLWNLEIVMYADGTTNFAKPTIAGVYGDSAITLRVYSLDGYEFSDSVELDDKVENITLQVEALKGMESIENATFTWSHYLPIKSSEGTGKGEGSEQDEGVAAIDDVEAENPWIVIEDYANKKEVVVNINNPYALNTLRCTMHYKETETSEEKQIYDQVTLTKKNNFYNASIKFFSGNHIFTSGQEHIAGYVEVYKNNKLVEYPASRMLYHCNNIDPDTNVITTDYIRPTDSDDPDYNMNQMYFSHHIYATENTEEKCEIVLGKYDEESQVWKVDKSQSQYIYVTDDDLTMDAGVFIISKNDVIRSKDINIKIYADYTTDDNGNQVVNLDSLLTSASVTLMDLNDTIVGDESVLPPNPYDGQMWFNTKENVLMVYKVNEENNIGSWVYSFAQQVGKTVYVEAPQSYSEGDLWIVADHEIANSYREATNVTEDIFKINPEQYYIYDEQNYQYTQVTEYADNITYYLQYTYPAGTTLKARRGSDTFDPTHWIAADMKSVNMKENMLYFFDTDVNTGILKIGPVDKSYWVDISGNRMAFFAEDPITPKVEIGTNSTHIRNLVADDSADFNCRITVDSEIEVVNTNEDTKGQPLGFVWKIENDGGFSLVKKEA